MLRLENGRLCAQVIIQNKTLIATLDTGASSSFIVEHRARELDNGQELKKQSMRVELVNGTHTDATQYLMVTIRLGSEQVYMPISIMSSMHQEVVLGRDFMCGINFTIQCGGFYLRLEGQSIEQLHETEAPLGQARDTLAPPEDVKILSAAIPEEPSTSAPLSGCQPQGIQDEEAGAPANKSTDWVIGPPEWRVLTPNNTLPATLRDRLVKKLQQAPKKDIKFLVEVEFFTFRVHINKSGKLTLRLHLPGCAKGVL